MKKACTIGSATQDLFMQYEGADTIRLHTAYSNSSLLVFPQGTKIDVPQIHYAVGGGAANVAVGLKRIGFDVEAFIRTGNDSAGQYIRDTLSKEKVSTRHSTIDPQKGTALSFIIPSRENDHVALCYRAANKNLAVNDFPLSLLSELDLLYIAPLGGQSQTLLPHVASQAHKAGIIVAINPSISQLTQHTTHLIHALKSCTILIMNTLESGYLMQALLQEKRSPIFSHNKTADSPSLLQPFLSFDTVNKSFSLYQMAHYFLSSGPQIIMVTNGSEGVYAIDHEQIYYYPSIPAKSVYGLGAGDAFSSACVGGILQGNSIEKSLILGIINASSVIQHQDAQHGLLPLATLEQKASLLKHEPKLLSTYRLNE